MKLRMETVIMPVYELPSGRAKNSGRFSLLFMFFGHLRKWLKRIEDIDEEKKEKKLNPWLLEKKIGQNCRLSINKRESFLNADKNTLNAKSLFYSRFIY